MKARTLLRWMVLAIVLMGMVGGVGVLFANGQKESSASTAKIRIGYIVKTLGNTFWQKYADGVKQPERSWAWKSWFATYRRSRILPHN